jgi:hypothetical protein
MRERSESDGAKYVDAAAKLYRDAIQGDKSLDGYPGVWRQSNQSGFAA